jgi:hypothetical protein
MYVRKQPMELSVTRGEQLSSSIILHSSNTCLTITCKCHNRLTLSLLMSYIHAAPYKARNFNVIYIWTYVWQG